MESFSGALALVVQQYNRSFQISVSSSFSGSLIVSSCTVNTRSRDTSPPPLASPVTVMEGAVLLSWCRGVLEDSSEAPVNPARLATEAKKKKEKRKRKREGGQA
jgi:hypothetical protein